MGDILDNNFLDIDEVKKKLGQAGIHNFYEIENQQIVVSESHTVRVTLKLINNKIVTKRKFPAIGNTFQVVFTVVSIIIFNMLDIPFSLFIAIALGQLGSYIFYMPKIKKLESRLNTIFDIE